MQPDDPATPANLAALRKAVSGDESGLAHHSDRSLSRFLRAKKTVDKAAALVKTYDDFVAEQGFQNLTYADVEKAHSLGIMRCHPNFKDKEGRTLLWSMPGLIDHSLVEPKDVQRLIFFTLDWLTTTHEEVQLNGVALCANWAGFSITKFRPALPKLVLRTVQEVMPVRMKAIYHINQSTFFDMVLGIITPLMNEKLRSRLIMVGAAERLRQYVDSDKCMVEAGGAASLTVEEAKVFLLAGKSHTANPLYPSAPAPKRDVVHM